MGAGAGAGAAAPGGELDLAALQNNPQIQQLRDLMMQNPALIQPLIQQLGAQNPALMQMIQQNPAAVARLFGVDGAEFDDNEDGPVPPGAHVVSVTEEERAAIQRVCCFFLSLLTRPVTHNLFSARGVGLPAPGCAGSILCMR